MSEEAIGAESIRRYLLWLEDPSSVRDHAAIAEAQATAAETTDPLERLKALSAVQRLEAIDGDQFRASFVEHARLWAQNNAVTPEAFLELGVSAETLRNAGILEAVAPSASRGPTKRRTRISPEAVRAAIPNGPFTIAMLEETSGASTATVRKVIAEMTDAGSLRDLGPKLDHAGRGRAPLLFTKG